MISSNSDTVKKVNDLVSYSTSQKPHYEDYYRSCTVAFISAVNSYFQRDRATDKRTMSELQHGLYSYFNLRGTEFNPPVDLELGALPFSDFSQIYYDFPVNECDNDTFYNAWVYDWQDATQSEYNTLRGYDVPTRVDIDPVTQSATYKAVKPVSNTLVESWLSAISTHTSEYETERLTTYSESLSDAMCNCSNTMLWSELGEVIRYPKKIEIANSVFNDMHLKNYAKYLNIYVKIPKYL